MNFFLLAFVVQIIGLYAMILLSDYVMERIQTYRNVHRLKKSTMRLRR